MVKNKLELKPHDVLTDKEIKFISRFSNDSDRNLLVVAISEGITLDELEMLGIDREDFLSMKKKAALFVRYRYKASFRAACKIIDQSFNERQLDTITNVLLMPAFGIPEEKVIEEILYDKYSAEEMIAWFNNVRSA